MQQQDATRRTVGDTATIVHRVAIPRDGMVEARLPTDSNLVTLVGPPTVTREGDSVRIAYTVTFWTTGQNQLVIPGPIVARPGVRPDTLDDLKILLDVASVLPSKDLKTLAPKDARPWLPDAEDSTLPLMILLPIVIIALAVTHWRWRRRGPRPITTLVAAEPMLTIDRVNAWLKAGEGKTLLRHIEATLPTEESEDAEDAEIGAWRERVAAVRYAPADDATVEALAREGWALMQRGLK